MRDLRLHFLHFLVGGTQGLLLQKNRLGQQIGRIGLRPYGVGDKGLCVAIARRIGLSAHAFKQIGEHLAFFGRHETYPLAQFCGCERRVTRRPLAEYGPRGKRCKGGAR